jgi:hypothetical protein
MKFKCKGINQVAIAAKDIEKVAKSYWNILGIGSWLAPFFAVCCL